MDASVSIFSSSPIFTSRARPVEADGIGRRSGGCGGAGAAIDEVLDLTVREALQLFAGQPRVVRRLKAMDQIGLGYLRLGQPAGSLSGGEAQRMKLALHLQRRAGQNVLYVLDEPTAGLHQGDVAELASSFGKLLEAGATLVVVEHNLDILRLADWVIDLGPGAGPAGGQVVFEGPPEQMLANGRGRTASALRTSIREAAASSSALR